MIGIIIGVVSTITCSMVFLTAKPEIVSAGATFITGIIALLILFIQRSFERDDLKGSLRNGIEAECRRNCYILAESAGQIQDKTNNLKMKHVEKAMLNLHLFDSETQIKVRELYQSVSWYNDYYRASKVADNGVNKKLCSLLHAIHAFVDLYELTDWKRTHIEHLCNGMLP